MYRMQYADVSVYFGCFALAFPVFDGLSSLRWLAELLVGECRAVLCAVVGWNGGLVVVYRIQYTDVSACFVLFVWYVRIGLSFANNVAVWWLVAGGTVRA